jgi:hypothetical protein
MQLSLILDNVFDWLFLYLFLVGFILVFLWLTDEVTISLLYSTLQMMGRWESNINVWFRSMYSQKWNCAASLFPKQNYNGLSPNSCICEGFLHILYSHDRSSQIRKWKNWEWGRAVSLMGIYVSNFRYSDEPLPTSSVSKLGFFSSLELLE